MDEKGYKLIKYPNCNAHFENDYNVSRVLYVDNELKPKCKFREEITVLDNGVSIDKRSICIGFNPAKAEEEIDTTNKRLITLLWNQYNGYNLLNLYPEITDNKNQIDLGDKENIEFLEKLIKELEIETRDIILFFGRTTAISIIQLLHVVPGILVALLSNWFFGKSRMSLDLNLSFFANIMIMYATFNVLFFPKYFKTAFFFGKPAVLGSFVAILYMLVIEVLNIGFPIINQVFESEDYLIVQVLMFVGSIVLFFISLLFSIRRSTKHFENRQ